MLPSDAHHLKSFYGWQEKTSMIVVGKKKWQFENRVSIIYNILREMSNIVLYAVKHFQIYSVFTQEIWRILIVDPTACLLLSADF